MARRTSRAESRRRARQGRQPPRAARLGRNQLIGAALLALGVAAGLIWISNGNVTATPGANASGTAIPSGTSSAVPGTHVRGAATAAVVIEEWADFQCPACGAFARQTEPKVMQDYVDAGKVRWVFHQFPFLGPESTWAAQASECAADEGKFWEYHDKLFASQAGENRGAFSKANLKRFGADLGLGDQFARCVDSGRHLDEVQASLEAGRSLGVDSTPTFFINGKKYARAYPYDQFKTFIDPLLAK